MGQASTSEAHRTVPDGELPAREIALESEVGDAHCAIMGPRGRGPSRAGRSGPRRSATPPGRGTRRRRPTGPSRARSRGGRDPNGRRRPSADPCRGSPPRPPSPAPGARRRSRRPASRCRPHRPRAAPRSPGTRASTSSKVRPSAVADIGLQPARVRSRGRPAPHALARIAAVVVRPPAGARDDPDAGRQDRARDGSRAPRPPGGHRRTAADRSGRSSAARSTAVAACRTRTIVVTPGRRCPPSRTWPSRRGSPRRRRSRPSPAPRRTPRRGAGRARGSGPGPRCSRTIRCPGSLERWPAISRGPRRGSRRDRDERGRPADEAIEDDRDAAPAAASTMTPTRTAISSPPTAASTPSGSAGSGRWRASAVSMTRDLALPAGVVDARAVAGHRLDRGAR